MKKFIAFTSAVAACFISGFAISDHHRATMEVYSCNYANGKDISDLKKVTTEWDKWADDNHSEAYAGYIFTPILADRADFPMDFIWVGFAENDAKMGTIWDEWIKKGGRLQEKFDNVAPCNAHAEMSTYMRREYPPSTNGIVEIRSCKMQEGVSGSQIYRASNETAELLTENEIPGGNYAWVPGAGSTLESDVDYYEVWVTESLTERGKGKEKLRAMNRSDFRSIWGDSSLRECGNSRVWHAEFVGGKMPD